eukprot:CAMPEP_0114609078 /NCGR_PEP_ID=MMETSP0168-20121206/2905_1 /TAXON_ID=95228 ORGANISM="Vannella sp., Strain DIVA3 517/6/12" /NCGR_SAMPLE_ID=MMETSP0168 /ASSEMBLY_ACC=CAM_ASM_000044 /LENGTH=253 /DNA_ID=CAMNT_0001819989 /DNA_START=107 /DNA_END=864 /DNA_ORIENTATION=-
MRIVQVPVLDDNYAYLLIDEESGEAAAVDPAVPSPLLSAAERENVKITTVLTTHHHWDHAQGNDEMAAAIPGLTVVGGDDRISSMTTKVTQDDKLTLGAIDISVLFTPCHTTGHVLYFVNDPRHDDEPPSLFSGDTLFVGGCGKFFEGNGAQMYEALCKKIAALPHSTQVQCGHEYTVSNLRFAASLTPDNVTVKEKLQWATERREKSLTTVPSTVGEELTYNPFMRVESDEIKAALGLPITTAPEEVMTVLR